MTGALLRAIRYERIQVYEDLGQHRKACSELEKLYAEVSDYEDMAARLELLALESTERRHFP